MSEKLLFGDWLADGVQVREIDGQLFVVAILKEDVIERIAAEVVKQIWKQLYRRSVG